MTADKRASLVAVVGSTGSGKSFWIKNQLRANPGRLLIWDAMNEYADSGARLFLGAGSNGMQPLVTYITENHRREFAARFVPDKSDDKKLAAQFSLFCGLAYAAGRCVLVIEELSMLTRAGFAPARWRECVVTGRHVGLTIIGTTQRPALVDKTFFSNATVIRCGRLGSAGDKKAMADALDVPVADVRALMRLEWIIKDTYSGEVTREGAPNADKTARKRRAPK